MWKAIKRNPYPYLFISPYIILFLVFQLIPLFQNLYNSLFTTIAACTDLELRRSIRIIWQSHKPADCS